jgi:hypothetical protein
MIDQFPFDAEREARVSQVPIRKMNLIAVAHGKRSKGFAESG